MEYSFCQIASFTHKCKFYDNKEESAIMDQKRVYYFSEKHKNVNDHTNFSTKNIFHQTLKKTK